MFARTSSSNPVITDTLSVTPNQRYEMTIEVYGTDLDDSDEYIEITVDGNNIGRCTPNVANSQCSFYSCKEIDNSNNIFRREIYSSDSTISIRANFIGVGSGGGCFYDGVTTYGVMRFTLSPTSNAFGMFMVFADGILNSH